MSTTTVPQPEAKAEAKAESKKPSKIPSLNPYYAPEVICSNRDCRKVMKPQVVTDRGGEMSVRYDCVPCNYSFYASMIHAQGICKPLGQEKAGPPEARR